MKLWGVLRTDGKLTGDALLETEHLRKSDVKDYAQLIGELCHALDLSRPVLLNKHLNDFERFSRAVFKPEDFMEPVSFDRFEVELFFKDVKKREENVVS